MLLPTPNWPEGLSEALYKALVKRLPPQKNSEHLEDLVKALLDALAHGEHELILSKSSQPAGLKNEGWPEAHYKALLLSGWVNSKDSPMVLNGDHLGWRRWHGDMEAVTTELINRAELVRELSTDQIKEGLFEPPKRLNKEQQAAVKAIETKGIVLISGGPGTGKTSTIVEMLVRAKLLSPNLKIGLAAPTGKAARKLKDALQKTVEENNTPSKYKLAGLSCNTIHKWLQARSQGFGKNKQNPIDLDLFVIDEMSMVDLSLMKALLNAIPKTTQLILVGDPNQLPPIGSGAVWNHLQSPRVKNYLQNNSIDLNQVYRNRGAIASLSKTLREKGISSFWQGLSNVDDSENMKLYMFRGNELPELVIKRLNQQKIRLEQLTKNVITHLPNDFSSSFIEDNNLSSSVTLLIKQLNSLLVLCPKHHGKWGVNEVHKFFLGRNFQLGIEAWPQGTPVMCGENQPELSLANGDIGLVIGNKDKRRILFRIISEEGSMKTTLIHPARLRAINPAMALTIHKAQGSESNEVILLWPEVPEFKSDTQTTKNSYKSRLLYTAITRASRNLNLISSKDSQKDLEVN